jgi:hypothetical protein
MIDGIEQLAGLGRFKENRCGSGGMSYVPHGTYHEAGRRQNSRRQGLGTDLPDDFQSVLIRETQVDDDHIKRPAANLGQSPLRRGHGSDKVASFGKNTLGQSPDSRFIFNYKNAWYIAQDSIPCSCGFFALIIRIRPELNQSGHIVDLQLFP